MHIINSTHTVTLLAGKQSEFNRRAANASESPNHTHTHLQPAITLQFKQTRNSDRHDDEASLRTVLLNCTWKMFI